MSDALRNSIWKGEYNPMGGVASKSESRINSKRSANAILRGSTAVYLAAVVAGGLVSTANAQDTAVQQATVVTFNIGAQDLGSALTAFADRAGLRLLLPSSLVAGKRSDGISGTFTKEQALANLLKGTGLAYRFTNASTVTIVDPSTGNAGGASADGATALEAIILRGQSQTTEGTGSYTTGEMASATKLGLTARQTPQSVSVITDQKIKDRNYGTLNEALRDAPGVISTNGFGETRWEYWARGSTIDNIQYDGVSGPIQIYSRDAFALEDLAMYDHVEIVRGANGLTEGAGNPAATVNLVRKKPTDEKQIIASTTASSWKAGRVMLDASSPLNDDNSLRGRFVAVGSGGDGFRDFYSSRNALLYGVLEADLGDSTTVSLGYSYQKENIDGYDWGGLPNRTDGSFYDFDSDSYIGYDDSYLNKTQNTIYADLEHEFDNGWTFNTSARVSRASSVMLSSYTVPGSMLNRLLSDDYIGMLDHRFEYDEDTYSLDAHLSGEVDLFGREHDVVFGVSGSRDVLNVVSWRNNWHVVNPETWDPAVGSITGLKQYAVSDYEKTQGGFYGATRLNLADNLKLILGGRVSWFEGTTSVVQTSTNSSKFTENGKFAPYAGIVYDITDDLTAYASYTTIFQPQNNYGVDGSVLPAIEGTNVEVGLKADLFDDRATASFALYETRRKNIATIIPGVSYCVPNQPNCYEASDLVRTRGFEVELSGELTDGWNLTASYAYGKSKYIKGENAGTDYGTEKFPEHMGKIFTTYQLSGAWEKLTIGGGVRMQSELTYDGTVATASGSKPIHKHQPGYAVADLMARYDFTPETQLQLNVNNVFNKQYYSSISNTISGNFMGAPRNVTLTLTHKF